MIMQTTMATIFVHFVNIFNIDIEKIKENILDKNKKFISFNNNQVEANYYNNLGFNLDKTYKIHSNSQHTHQRQSLFLFTQDWELSFLFYFNEIY